MARKATGSQRATDKPVALKLLTHPDDVLNRDDTQYDTVPVPEWDCNVRLRTLGADEVSIWLEGSYAPGGAQTSVGRLLSLCIVDDKGARVFTEAHVEGLRKKNSKAINRLFERANAMNELLDERVVRLFAAQAQAATQAQTPPDQPGAAKTGDSPPAAAAKNG